MAIAPDSVLVALRLLLRASHVVGPDDLPDLVARATAEISATKAVIHIVDFDQQTLVPLTGDVPGGGTAPGVVIDGTLAGRAFIDVSQYSTTTDTSTTVWAPMVDGTDRLGVLQVEFSAGTRVDDSLVNAVKDVASLVAEMVSTRSVYGDAVQRARRGRNLTIPAELQWTLLPPLTFVSPRVAVAGVVAPTAEVAGDCFDYALNGDTLHVAIFDAMGHGTEAALMAALAVSTYRNARRTGLDLIGTVTAIDAALADEFGVDKFVTGIVGELHVPTGVWQWTTAGHPGALLLRGAKVVKVLDQVVGPPLGLGLLSGDTIGQERLEPGDRLLLYTDGVVEARDAGGEFFGSDRLAAFVAREESAGRPAAETMRRLNHAILGHQEGALQDDATTVMVEWLTGEAEESTPDP